MGVHLLSFSIFRLADHIVMDADNFTPYERETQIHPTEIESNHTAWKREIVH